MTELEVFAEDAGLVSPVTRTLVVDLRLRSWLALCLAIIKYIEAKATWVFSLRCCVIMLTCIRRIRNMSGTELALAGPSGGRICVEHTS